MKVLKQATNVLFPNAMRPSASPSQLPGDLVKIWEPPTALQAVRGEACRRRLVGPKISDCPEFRLSTACLDREDAGLFQLGSRVGNS